MSAKGRGKVSFGGQEHEASDECTRYAKHRENKHSLRVPVEKGSFFPCPWPAWVIHRRYDLECFSRYGLVGVSRLSPCLS